MNRSETVVAERRPIRVVLFYGPYLRSAREFAVRLEAHPDVELAAAWCVAPGETRRHQLADLRRRRGWLGLALFGFEVARDGLRRLIGGSAEAEHRRRWRALARRVRYVEDVHSTPVLDEVRECAPDLGLSYGGPILRPELFRIPRHGTLGIHHGRMPAYRGKKTTFWEIWEGEPAAGVTIQRIGEGIDTGDVVAQDLVEIGGRSYETVWNAVQRRGLDLFVESVLAVGEGTATFRPLEGAKGPLRTDPTAWQLLRLPLRRLRLRLKGRPGAEAP